MIGFSRLLDRPARAAVALLLRRDLRAASPSSTALVLVNPIAPLAELDPAGERAATNRECRARRRVRCDRAHGERRWQHERDAPGR
jgi:hypothetical protein